MEKTWCNRADVVPAACGGFVVRAVFPKHAGAWAEFYGVSGRGLPAGELEKRPLRPVETFPTEAEARAFMDSRLQTDGDPATEEELDAVDDATIERLKRVRVAQLARRVRAELDKSASGHHAAYWEAAVRPGSSTLAKDLGELLKELLD